MSAANTLMNANVHIAHCMYSTCAYLRLLVESAPVAVLTCVESVVVVQFQKQVSLLFAASPSAANHLELSSAANHK